MNNCEIVDNVACGVSFQYCRTHKVEPKDCPGNKMTAPTMEPNPYQGIMENLARVHAQTLQKDFQKREFKVGDSIRHRGEGMVFKIETAPDETGCFIVSGAYDGILTTHALEKHYDKVEAHASN